MGGLEGGEDFCWLRGVGFVGLLVAEEVFEELAYYAEAFFRLGELCCGGEEALFGVGGDFFDGLGGIFSFVAGGFGLAGEVGAGDLEAVEEEAGAAGVDLVAGDAAEDFADGELDGGAVFGHGEVEVGLVGLALAWVLHGAAGGVVVVAEVFVA